MKKHILKFRAIDDVMFDYLKRGVKTIETRAGSPKYKKIRAGDTLVIICGQEEIEKKVKSIKTL